MCQSAVAETVHPGRSRLTQQQSFLREAVRTPVCVVARMQTDLEAAVLRVFSIAPRVIRLSIEYATS